MLPAITGALGGADLAGPGSVRPAAVVQSAPSRITLTGALGAGTCEPTLNRRDQSELQGEQRKLGD